MKPIKEILSELIQEAHELHSDSIPLVAIKSIVSLNTSSCRKINDDLVMANKTVDLLIEREEELIKDLNCLRYNTGISHKLNERVGYRISETLVVKQLQNKVIELEAELEDIQSGLSILNDENN